MFPFFPRVPTTTTTTTVVVVAVPPPRRFSRLQFTVKPLEHVAVHRSFVGRSRPSTTSTSLPRVELLRVARVPVPLRRVTIEIVQLSPSQTTGSSPCPHGCHRIHGVAFCHTPLTVHGLPGHGLPAGRL